MGTIKRGLEITLELSVGFNFEGGFMEVDIFSSCVVFLMGASVPSFVMLIVGVTGAEVVLCKTVLVGTLNS